MNCHKYHRCLLPFRSHPHSPMRIRSLSTCSQSTWSSMPRGPRRKRGSQQLPRSSLTQTPCGPGLCVFSTSSGEGASAFAAETPCCKPEAAGMVAKGLADHAHRDQTADWKSGTRSQSFSDLVAIRQTNFPEDLAAHNDGYRCALYDAIILDALLRHAV